MNLCKSSPVCVSSPAVGDRPARSNERLHTARNGHNSASVLFCRHLQGNSARVVTKPDIEDLVLQRLTITAIEELKFDFLCG